MTELTPEKLREAADVIEQYSICKGSTRPSDYSVSANWLRFYADELEAKNAEKAKRDKAIEELVTDMYPTDELSLRGRAVLLYDAGWRKQ